MKNDVQSTSESNDVMTLRAFGIIKRWLEWARAHGHLEHAAGIVCDSRELIANVPVNRRWLARTCCFCQRTDGSVEVATTRTPMHRQCLRLAALGSMESSVLPNAQSEALRE